MDPTRFWQYKIVQFFHDPPGKPFASWPGTGGHKKVALDLFKRFTKVSLKGYAPYPDWAASGADRPMVTPPRGKGISPLKIAWHKNPIITHPLSRGYIMDLRRRDAKGELKADAELKEDVFEDQTLELEELGKSFADWRTKQDLEDGFFRLWRRYRDELVFRKSPGPPFKGDTLWAEMPSDTRCPDHSIWDHLRVTTALAFLTKKTPKPDVPWNPWLFRFSIGPVQRFIQESRTSRDLWLSSFLLSDLVWHAMLPLVKLYGPDCIVYPDLRGNPRVDVWLCESHRDALPDFLQNPSTYAAMLPGTFVALLPYGGKGHLKKLKELAKEAETGFKNRWSDLANMVKTWLTKEIKDKKYSAWSRTWDRQHEEPPLYATWTAVPWMMAELPVDPETKKERPIDPECLRGRALPAQRPGFRSPVPGSEPDRQAIGARQQRLAPWVNNETWARYELAREVFIRTNPSLATMERGFEYALTHHQLVVRHGLRRQTAPDPVSRDGEPGEKCTLCGKRTALGGETEERRGRDHVDSARQAAREFWTNENLDPEQRGAERLCAVCAMKRFLVDAGYDMEKKKLSGINPIWAGPVATYDKVADMDGKVRVPFPSTATLASQESLALAATDASFSENLAAINRAHKDAGLPRTSFPRSLPRLAEAFKKAHPAGKEFLMRETQDTLFPNALEGMVQYWEKRDKDKAGKLKKLLNEVRKLHRKLSEINCQPKIRIAVICLDGDRMGRLITGEADAIETRWQDVLHPDIIQKIKKNQHLIDAGWLDLLSTKRLTGPSLHAFINRALGHFSHRIVPWVVEQEFSGRVIYAGGDDVLCLAPAEDAIDIAARLMQLFSAAWVIDTDYQADPWKWRNRDWQGSYDLKAARKRFQIPKQPNPGGAIRLPVPHQDQLEIHCSEREGISIQEADGMLLPMLGHGCSLSAGIVYGHYKTPLGVMLSEARRLLDEMAKERAGRRSIALGHFSRNGLKTQFAVSWDEGGRLKGTKILKDVCNGFKKNSLSRRLPYKLREIMPLVTAARRQIIKQEDHEKASIQWNRLIAGFFANACDSMEKNIFKKEDRKTKEAKEAAFRAWKQGIKLYAEQDGTTPYPAEKAVDGLLVCRYLAGEEEDEQ